MYTDHCLRKNEGGQTQHVTQSNAGIFTLYVWSSSRIRKTNKYFGVTLISVYGAILFLVPKKSGRICLVFGLSLHPHIRSGGAFIAGNGRKKYNLQFSQYWYSSSSHYLPYVGGVSLRIPGPQLKNIKLLRVPLHLVLVLSVSDSRACESVGAHFCGCAFICLYSAFVFPSGIVRWKRAGLTMP